MKKILYTAAFAALFCTASLRAQAPNAYPMPLADSPNAPEYVQPYTTVVVKLTVEEETFKAGPYARYSQKYLGAMASLADRKEYRIKGVDLDYLDPAKEAKAAKKTTGVKVKTPSLTRNRDDFPRSTLDRVSAVDKTTEEMAREAANTIYTLRKRRFDLVTGEAGENVYGDGIKAAITEMDRMENEYLALFLGKQVVRTYVKEFKVIPTAGRNNYVVCRFDAEGGGFVPESDLSGRPIALVLTPENTLSEVGSGKADKKGTGYYRVAEWVNCKVLDGSSELASERLPVYQFGKTVVGPAIN